MNTHVHLRALVLAAVSLSYAALAHAACPAGGVFANEQRWAGNTVTVRFNPTLDLPLERAGFGNSATRIVCFVAAVDAWNNALQMVAPNRLTIAVEIDSTTAWAADRGNQKCVDATDQATRVDDADYAIHHGDGDNCGSTGHGAQYDPEAHGWITGSEIQTYVIDHRLAECNISPDGTGAPADPPVEIEEADILWFTHFEEQNFCPRIDWDYRGAVVINGYDFYSVMLHELGHLLGLMHQSPDGVNDNVMRPTLNPGQRASIKQGELDCLAFLYAPNDPVPVKTQSWGQIKSLYR